MRHPLDDTPPPYSARMMATSISSACYYVPRLWLPGYLTASMPDIPSRGTAYAAADVCCSCRKEGNAKSSWKTSVKRLNIRAPPTGASPCLLGRVPRDNCTHLYRTSYGHTGVVSRCCTILSRFSATSWACPTIRLLVSSDHATTADANAPLLAAHRAMPEHVVLNLLGYCLYFAAHT